MEKFQVADGTFVYALNAQGSNRIWAAVTPGVDNHYQRITVEECANIATIFAEAGNVYHETGKTPRDLLKEVNKLRADNSELLEALKLIANAENSGLDLAYCKGIASAAISKALGGAA